eukprot:GFUD01028382.1.p1 GENE.GFUD01028382.1~~GFUD01028382.1.p1  ORF type:complete len:100 (-),score=19.90 GFUD01028382.1:300-599(-)
MISSCSFHRAPERVPRFLPSHPTQSGHSCVEDMEHLVPTKTFLWTRDEDSDLDNSWFKPSHSFFSLVLGKMSVWNQFQPCKSITLPPSSLTVQPDSLNL